MPKYLASYGTQILLWTKHLLRLANEVHEVVANKPSKIELTTFTTVEKKLITEMVVGYAIRSSVIHLTDIGTINTEMCKSLNLMIDQAKAAPIR